MSAVTMTRIGLSRSVKVAAGTLVIAYWPITTPIPTLEGFRAGPLAALGALWDLSWMTYHHVGITLSRDVTELELAATAAKANGGRAAVLTAWTGIEDNVKLDQLGAEGKQAAIDFAAATIKAIGNGASTALWFAKYGIYLIAGIVLLGLIVVAVLVLRKKKGS